MRIKSLIDVNKVMLPPDGGPDFNRLIFSTSPYLLQHADNPVDWRPWGEEAFAQAVAEDKPLFLSIGYSTCHWCHVMAHESFEDPEAAELFNRTFVCIKVDREERPDIDEQYMAIAQILTGSGGWPLNIFMTPDKKPFYAATYIPRFPRNGMPGILQVLEYFHSLWTNDRKKLLDNSVSALDSLKHYFTPNPGSLSDMSVMDEAFKQLTKIHDLRSGGFGAAPKFPLPLYPDFLLRYAYRDGNQHAIDMVEHTLRSMRCGGIYDQLGFGFHRYSVDSRWLVPHFEKMLYDQALISLAYLQAFQATSDSLYLQVAEEILSYVMNEMTSNDGAFFAGEDADSEGEEGKYYLWSPAEIADAIGAADSRIFCKLFDVTDCGNYEGKNILNLPVTLDEFCTSEGGDTEQLRAQLERWRSSLLTVRNERLRPFRDEKIVTAWNGLMVTAFARGYAVSGNATYRDAAVRAVDFILARLTGPSGRLMRSFHLGTAVETGFLEDYACLTGALIELHQVTLDEVFLEKACFFAGEMIRLFASTDSGALYETGSDAEELLVRHISSHDGVVPSGNSMAASAMLRLGRITADTSYTTRGEAILQSFMGTITRNPLNSIYFLSALDYSVLPEVSVTLSGNRDALDTMIRALYCRFMPNLVVRYAGNADTGDFPAIGGRPTAYVCAKGACRPPVSTINELDVLLNSVAGY